MKQHDTYKKIAEADLFDQLPQITPSAQWGEGLMAKMALAGSKGSKPSSVIWLSLAIGCILLFNGLLFFRLENISITEDTGRQQLLKHFSDELLITEKQTN